MCIQEENGKEVKKVIDSPDDLFKVGWTEEKVAGLRQVWSSIGTDSTQPNCKGQPGSRWNATPEGSTLSTTS